MSSKAELRRKLRRQRAALTPEAHTKARLNIARSARLCSTLFRAQRVASYVAFEGEIQPDLLIEKLPNAKVFLPRISNYRTHQMHFLPADNGVQLSRFGISEPLPTTPPMPANRLDVILLPLVAFDRSGNRLGMGAGYYDRALSSLAHQPRTRPYLLGLAHHFQEVKSLNPSPWDVPLDAILTDQEFIQTRR